VANTGDRADRNRKQRGSRSLTAKSVGRRGIRKLERYLRAVREGTSYRVGIIDDPERRREMVRMRIWLGACHRILSLLLTGLLASASGSAAQTKDRPQYTEEKASSNKSNLTCTSSLRDESLARSAAIAAAADSNQRFALWLFAQTNDTNTLQSSKLSQALATDFKAGLRNASFEEFEIHIIWSWGDQGFCESGVQREIERLDVKFHKNMFATCIWPGGLFGRTGRACVMQIFACDAAKSRFDEMAWEMTIATQMHNGEAVGVLRAAGPTKVANFIRENRGCR